MSWSQIATGAFAHRDDANIFRHRGRVWIGGGYSYGAPGRQDLLASHDGTAFSTVNSSTPFEVFTPICSHDGVIYNVGRFDVHSTPDGVNFTNAGSSPVSGVYPRALLSFDGKLWLIMPDGARYSTDGGATWSSPIALPWSDDVGIVATVALGKMVVFATVKIGTPNAPAEANYTNDESLAVMYFGDPVNGWEVYDIPYSPRWWPALAEHEKALYIFGGYSNFIPSPSSGPDVQKNTDELWRWTPVDGFKRIFSTTSPQPRHAASMLSVNGRLRVYAGNTGPTVGNTMSDIWELSL